MRKHRQYNVEICNKLALKYLTFVELCFKENTDCWEPEPFSQLNSSRAWLICHFLPSCLIMLQMCPYPPPMLNS